MSVDWNDFAIQLHLRVGLALKEDISFRQRLVVVTFRVFTDLCDVNGARELGHTMESSPSLTAGTGDRRDC
jgi:hypothetical protein